MRTLMLAVGLAMLAVLSTARVDTRPATAGRVPVAAVPLPSEVLSGMEVLLLVK